MTGMAYEQESMLSGFEQVQHKGLISKYRGGFEQTDNGIEGGHIR